MKVNDSLVLLVSASILSIVSKMPSRTDIPLQVAIIGAGLGGLGAAVALRRQGHCVTVYERYDFAGEVGASLSAASNGSRFLEEWGVDVKAAKPVSEDLNIETRRNKINWTRQRSSSSS